MQASLHHVYDHGPGMVPRTFGRLTGLTLDRFIELYLQELDHEGPSLQPYLLILLWADGHGYSHNVLAAFQSRAMYAPTPQMLSASPRRKPIREEANCAFDHLPELFFVVIRIWRRFFGKSARPPTYLCQLAVEDDVVGHLGAWSLTTDFAKDNVSSMSAY